MITKMGMLTAIIILALPSRWAPAADRKQSPGSQSDPVVQSLEHGVDHLDGTNPPNPHALQRRDARYQVVNGDVLELQFEFTPDFNQTVTVQPDGFITLKEIGDFRVQGQTAPEIKEVLQNAYAKILARPILTVYLRDFEKPYYLALGEVGRPGKYDLRGNTSVAGAVAAAGGFTSQAKHSQVLVFRRVDDNWSSVTKVNLKHMLKSRDLNEDLQLHPGDMVYVPKNTISKIKAFAPTPTVGSYLPIP